MAFNPFAKHDYPMFRRPPVVYRGGGIKDLLKHGVGQEAMKMDMSHSRRFGSGRPAGLSRAAKMGRYGDNSLMHVSGQELRGLAALAPGGLTRNPHTGLPEAFKLADLLGPALGLAGTIFAPGLGISSALGGAIGAGVGTTAGTGSLQKGLGAGLLSYGLGSAMGYLADAGTVPTGVDLPPSVAGAPTTAGTATAAERALSMPPMPTAGTATAADAAMGFRPMAPSTDPLGQLQAAGRGISQPGALRSTFIDNWKSTTLPIGAGALLALGPDGSGGNSIPSDASQSRKANRRYPEQLPGARNINFPGSDYRHGIMPEWRFGFAEGGNVQGDPLVQAAIAAMQGQSPNPALALTAFARKYGKDALYQLWEQVKGGGKVEGEGDGMSDSIPASIDGQQPAAISTGEYVVPADAVSGLGNGSTDSGAEKLDEMVGNLRYARHGTTQQPPPIDPNKVMP